MKHLLTLGGLLVACALARVAVPSAQAVTVTSAANPNLTVPDNDLNGAASTIALNTPFSSIASLSVTLEITGGYTGDFYAYLRHGVSGFAVLLNRVGSTANNPFGYADSGFNVTFDDFAGNGDIHNYANVVDPAGGTLGGVWQPDGRQISLSSDRPAKLSSFDGMDPNGDWTLFVADISSVGVGTLASWSITIEGPGSSHGVPDGGSTLAFVSAAFIMLAGLKSGRRIVRR